MSCTKVPRTRVLLVEDDDDDHFLTRTMLAEVRDQDYHLDWVRTYEDGLETIERGVHDACLLDNQLGGRTGLELLNACGGGTAPLPIIMLTGVHDRRIDQASMEAGASDYLVKGELNPAILERAIRYATERHRMRNELEVRAKYDSLTGLANRTLFGDFLAGAIGRSERGQRGLALFFLDLDHFKQINDTHGHAIGDALLVEVGRRLKACVRTGDLVARLGGDEFAIVLDNVGNPNDVGRIAHNILGALKLPCDLDGVTVHAKTSIGTALFPGDAKSSDDLIKAADKAMYEAKREGRDTHRAYSLPRQAKKCAADRLALYLADAVATDKIMAHYQPQFDMNTGDIIGIEALARWGKTSPEKFIAYAERSDLIVELGRNILHRTCRQFNAWRNAQLLPPTARLSVNISAVQLKGDGLLETVTEALDASGLPPHMLELELTETALMDDSLSAASTLQQLQNMNVRSVMDDFGTGYSSLTYLSKLPIRALKIDRSFVSTIGASRQNELIIKSIIGLANNLGLDLIAEGVETTEQSEFLLECECPVMQGWLFERALPPGELENRLRGGNRGIIASGAMPTSRTSSYPTVRLAQ